MKKVAQAILDDPEAATLLGKVFLHSGGGKILKTHDPLQEAVDDLIKYLGSVHNIDIEVYT